MHEVPLLQYTIVHMLRRPQSTSASFAACAPEAGAPPQERMAPFRRIWRQGMYRRHVAASEPQPTLRELLASHSTSPPALQSAPVTVILNHFKRHTLCRQIEALLAQSSGPPAHIWVCLFASPIAASARTAALSYNDSRIAIIESPHNFKYFGRFQLALSAPTRYVLVFDDDMVPGRNYLATLLHAAGSKHARGALLGSIGWLLPRPRPPPDARLNSYRSLRNDSGGAYLGLYVPDLAYDLLVERILEVDYLCSLWFGEVRLVRLLFREAPYTFTTGEDFHLSHMLRKYANAPSYVLPVLSADTSRWGDTDHALAYNRFSTGGASTIELRDQIWWNGVRGGGTVHWARRPAEPAPLGARSVLLVVDGLMHATRLAPLAKGLNARRQQPRAAVVAVALTGGLRGACPEVAPALGLSAEACEERRLLLFDMRLGSDQPTRPPPSSSSSSSSDAAPSSTAATPPSPVARARLDAESLTDLGQVLRAARPRVVIAVDDPDSTAVRSAIRLARFGGPPLVRIPPSTPSWALECLAQLPVHALARWGTTPLMLTVLASADRAALPQLHRSLAAAAMLHRRTDMASGGGGGAPRAHLPPLASMTALGGADRTELTVLVPHDSPPALSGVSLTGTLWPSADVHMRGRIAPVGEHTCATPEQRQMIAHVEAWMPRATAAHEPLPWGMVTTDDVELSEGFYVYVRHYIATTPADTDAADSTLLGIALGMPEGIRHGSTIPPHGGRLAHPTACASVYTNDGWRALRAFAESAVATLRLTGEGDAATLRASCEERRTAVPASWIALQEQFLRERAHTMHYPGVQLCRKRGDTSVNLASGDEVAALLAQR